MFRNLESVPLFKDVDASILHLLEPMFELYARPSGDIIFEQGEPAEFLYLLLEGAVEVLYKPYDGPAITMTNLTPGNFFGWSAAVGNVTYTSSAICKDNCQTLRIFGRDLRDLCVKNPDAGRIILERMAESVSTRWSNAHAQIHSLLNQSMKAKNRVSRPRRKGKRKMDTPTPTNNHTKEEQLKSLLERVSAYVEQFHGGSVDFVSFDGNKLLVRLGGACLGCPLSPATLHGWVAGTVHQFFPEVEVVAAD